MKLGTRSLFKKQIYKEKLRGGVNHSGSLQNWSNSRKDDLIPAGEGVEEEGI